MRMNIRFSTIYALLLVIQLQVKHGRSVDVADGSDTILSPLKNIVEKQQLKFWTNPCTGEISNDSGDEYPDCLKKPPTISPAPTKPKEPIVVTNKPSVTSSNHPSVPPSSIPSVRPSLIPSSIPSNLPSLIPSNHPSDAPSQTTLIYQCPHSQCSEDEFMDNAIKVNFTYKIETTQNVTDASSLLPAIESALLKELADKVLSHCLSSTDDGDDDEDGSTRKLLELPIERKLRRRSLQTIVDKSGATGVCSLPKDVLSSTDSCSPEVGDQCHVVHGAVSVTLGEDDSSEEVISTILNITQDAMKNDKLLSDDKPELEKVTFVGSGHGTQDGDGNSGDNAESEDEEIVVAVGNGEPDDSKKRDGISEGLIIGTSFAALASLLALFIIGKNRRKNVEEKVEDGSPFGMVEFPGVATSNSYIAPDRKNLGKISTNMDVHHCKSQTCEKCYTGPPVQFVNTPLNDNGRCVEANIDAVPTRTFTAESDGENDDMSQAGSTGSWTTVSFPRLAWW